ncbi:hypothetical protein P692DRAFT_20842214 [Suillus brevipes Sb2]|nr:hypothetical protein P692DRAFT_201798681 [Suillus brevipes Sb2]KAG2753429.1 hypothetical protein P692DRAFT_20842214 [Suillus brevipes Sb2]
MPAVKPRQTMRGHTGKVQVLCTCLGTTDYHRFEGRDARTMGPGERYADMRRLAR